jgi:hypothetical protein
MVSVLVPPAWNEGGEKLFSTPTAWTVKTSDVGEEFVSP